MAANPAVSPTALQATAARPWMQWTRDPFLHFLAIGLVLLALYSLVAPPKPAGSNNRIELTADDMLQMQAAWTSKWKRPPNAAELQGMVDQKVREEVLYREALAMGLDQDDTIVKRRMAQKVEFLTEDVAALRDPTPAELEAWFAGHADLFAMPSRITFRHLYFSPDKRGPSTESDARAALVQLLQSQAGAVVAGVGDAFPDHDYYAERTPDQLAGFFGLKFSKALDQMQPGAWQGPIQSGLGWHLVWIDALTVGRVPSFAEADQAEVKSAWMDDQRKLAKHQMYNLMRSKYEVIVPAVAAE